MTPEISNVTRPEYPRPDFVRPLWINLNGEWEFEFDDANEGLQLGWYDGRKLTRRIVVPFPYQSQLSGIDDRSVHESVWYARAIELSEKDREGVLVLNFEAVDYPATVWLNVNTEGQRSILDVTVFLHAPSCGWRVEVEVLEEGKFITRAEDTTAVATGRLHLTIPYAKLWSPENPNIYDLRISLFDGETLLDEVTSYVGLREIELREGKLFLNGKPTYLKMVLDQGYWPEGLLAAPSHEALQTK